MDVPRGGIFVIDKADHILWSTTSIESTLVKVDSIYGIFVII